MTPATLLDLLTVQLPASGEAVNAWAGRVSVKLVAPAPDLDHPAVPSAAWQALLAPHWPRVDLSVPVNPWAQILAYTWASEPASIHGSVERVLVQAWSRVPPHSWPSHWPVSALEMALALGWQTLPDLMLRQPRVGWRHPALTSALRKRLKVSTTQFEALAALVPDESTQSVWQRAGLAASVEDLRVLQGQDVTVPDCLADATPGTWPEGSWSVAWVKEWPAMHAAMEPVRATHPSAQAQHAPAGRALLVRALALGQMAVAEQLGWSAWLASAEPLVYREGPGQDVARSVLDGLAMGHRLVTPEALPQWLDQVFQAARLAGRPPEWSRPDDLAKERSPALRFWGRALGSGFQTLKSDPPYPGRRSPAWWRFTMQERAEVWHAWWAALAPTAVERWALWWHAVDRRNTAMNPWHLLAATRLPAAHTLLEGSPWAVLSGVEADLVHRCLDRLMHDAVANNERWMQAEVHWAMLSVARRWRQGQPASQPWVWLPLIWAWLSALDMAPEEDQPRAQRWARPWWRRLARWVRQDPALASKIAVAQAHQWGLVGHAATEARWRALLTEALPPPANLRTRARS